MFLFSNSGKCLNDTFHSAQGGGAFSLSNVLYSFLYCPFLWPSSGFIIISHSVFCKTGRNIFKVQFKLKKIYFLLRPDCKVTPFMWSNQQRHTLIPDQLSFQNQPTRWHPITKVKLTHHPQSAANCRPVSLAPRSQRYMVIYFEVMLSVAVCERRVDRLSIEKEVSGGDADWAYLWAQAFLCQNCSFLTTTLWTWQNN